jgi:hypothetical protein
MDAATRTDGFAPLPAWQAMLDRHALLFAEMLPGSAVGFVARSGSGIQPGKHLAALMAAGGEVEVLTWTMDGTTMRAGRRRCQGYQGLGVDLLFVADDDALAAMHDAIGGETLSIIKRQIRQGSMLFFVMRTKHELQDLGYEDFLDSLGLAFLGACR